MNFDRIFPRWLCSSSGVILGLIGKILFFHICSRSSTVDRQMSASLALLSELYKLLQISQIESAERKEKGETRSDQILSATSIMWRCGPLIRGTRLWRKKSWPFLAFLKAASLTQAGPSDENDNDHTGANDNLKPASCAGCERERRMEEVQPLCL